MHKIDGWLAIESITDNTEMPLIEYRNNYIQTERLQQPERIYENTKEQ